MSPSEFFRGHGLVQDPFLGEEAWQDAVLRRILTRGAMGPSQSGAAGSDLLAQRARHAELEKFIGDMESPGSAVVFGDKGSGKTAMRLMLEGAIARHNAAARADQAPAGAKPSPAPAGQAQPRRLLLIPHEDFGPMLESLRARLGGRPESEPRRARARGPAATAGRAEPGAQPPFAGAPAWLWRLRAEDHLDVILRSAVSALVAGVLGESGGGEAVRVDVGSGSGEQRAALRALPPHQRQTLAVLQALYDHHEQAPRRQRRLLARLGLGRGWPERSWKLAARLGWALPLGVLAWGMLSEWEPGWADEFTQVWELGFAGASQVSQRGVVVSTAAAVAGLAWAGVVLRRAAGRLSVRRLAHRVHRQVRALGRSERAVLSMLRGLPAPLRRAWQHAGVMPEAGGVERRLAMLDRAAAVLRGLGYRAMVVVVDRVDEAAQVAGDLEKMRPLVWPLLSNALLQCRAAVFKVLMPSELRHALFRESAGFFAQARVDKQSLVESLVWTGPMLYDLCLARLEACKDPATVALGAAPVPAAPIPGSPSPDAPGTSPSGTSAPSPDASGPQDPLAALFDQRVGRAGLTDALEAVRQPREALKLLHRCVVEHCAAVGRGDGPAAARISREVLDTVRREHAERARQVLQGVRPG
ncbi:MAG: hypothetical protein C0475_04145 [Planctomyces sp.]|nr:hypothetical protein [Planctomyces sp.]MBA4039116.1 hypothetical protein [Planctomyces sp.]MBA4120220.1 hypothetical protein [Isosphaera sp.]